MILHMTILYSSNDQDSYASNQLGLRNPLFANLSQQLAQTNT